MRLRCVVCGWEGDFEHLAVRCGGCGAAQAMKPAPGAGMLQPGEPICGPSRVQTNRQSVPVMAQQAERALAEARKPAVKQRRPRRRASEGAVARVAPRA
jgi:hypothetical protein